MEVILEKNWLWGMSVMSDENFHRDVQHQSYTYTVLSAIRYLFQKKKIKENI